MSSEPLSNTSADEEQDKIGTFFVNKNYAAVTDIGGRKPRDKRFRKRRNPRNYVSSPNESTSDADHESFNRSVQSYNEYEPSSDGRDNNWEKFRNQNDLQDVR